jgi:hypothetical protein
LKCRSEAGADGADAGVLVADSRDLVVALGLDARELELLGEDVGQLIHRDIHLEDVLALLLATLALLADPSPSPPSPMPTPPALSP